MEREDAIDIVQQFLAEALVLTGTGGAVGILVGVVASMAVSHYVDWPTSLSLWAVITAVALAASAGVRFGLYPAWHAAVRSPVEALRHEKAGNMMNALWATSPSDEG